MTTPENPEQPTARHGTTGGWRRHQRLGERPCDACAKAKAKYDRSQRKATDRQRRDRLYARAQAEAHKALRTAHPGEYQAAYQAAKERLLAEHEALADA